ncbi:MAG TPA: inosine/xanthosine triphosphatase [Gemmatimonadaceae bacterium]|nr:inosine/xanthosine triphosphatase [Gemmatimonadaceae bacterium]
MSDPASPSRAEGSTRGGGWPGDDDPATASSHLAAVRRVAVGSTNPVKVAAARAVLAPLVAPGAVVEGVAVASGVPDQPWGDDETIRGARARAAAALAASGADLAVAFEGGVVEEGPGGAVRTCAWAAVADRAGRSAVGGSLSMPLPPAVATMLRSGLELGHAIDALTDARDTKHGLGAVGVLTAGLVDRQRAYEVILTYALARWLGAEFWERAHSAAPR